MTEGVPQQVSYNTALFDSERHTQPSVGQPFSGEQNGGTTVSAAFGYGFLAVIHDIQDKVIN